MDEDPVGRGDEVTTVTPPGSPRRLPQGSSPPGIFLEDEPGATPDGPAGAPPPESDTGSGAGLATAAGLLATAGLLPLTAAALLPFWALLRLVADVPFVLVLVGYLLVGPALAFRSTQRLLLGAFFDARPPTPRELEVLEPAWHRVLDRAGVSHDRYVLAVSDLPHIDAVAAGGHVVAVSRMAMTVLPPEELEAALAHELGHHLGAHGLARLAALWLEAPVLLFARIGQWLELLAYAVAVLLALAQSFGPAFGALLAGLGIRLATYLVPTALGVSGLLHGLRNLFGRLSTYRADRVAVDLGLGEELIDLLERTVEHRMEGGTTTSSDQLVGGRSLVARRIARIEARLAAEDPRR